MTESPESVYTAGVRAFVARQRQLLAQWPQTRDVAARRERYAHYASLFAIAEPQGGVRRESLQLTWRGHSVSARLYEPLSCEPDRVVLYFHGGGFVQGSVQTHDSVTAFLAHHARAAVVSVDYRLAPEHRTPCQLEDAMAALQAVRERFGARARMAVAGESAGGTLAALLCQRAASTMPDAEGARIDAQMLVCPGPLWPDFSGDEFHQGNTDPFLRGSDLAYYADAYAGAAHTDAFLPGEHELAPVPPTVVYVAGHDPLRHQGLRYAAAVRRRGQARVRVEQGAGMIHSFIRVCATDAAAAADFAALCRTLSDMLDSPRETDRAP